MSAHTPGKWFTEQDSRGWVVYAPDPSPHADRHDLTVIADFLTEGNARLIVAASELMEALKEAHAYIDCIPESAAGGDDEAVRIARLCGAVIAKAGAAT